MKNKNIVNKNKQNLDKKNPRQIHRHTRWPGSTMGSRWQNYYQTMVTLTKWPRPCPCPWPWPWPWWRRPWTNDMYWPWTNERVSRKIWWPWTNQRWFSDQTNRCSSLTKAWFSKRWEIAERIWSSFIFKKQIAWKIIS